MKIKLHTIAMDDDNGTHGGVFATEDAMYDTLFASTGSGFTSYDRSDYEEWLKDNPDGNEHDWWEEHRGDLDSYTSDETTLEVDLCALPIPETAEARIAEANELMERIVQLNEAIND